MSEAKDADVDRLTRARVLQIRGYWDDLGVVSPEDAVWRAEQLALCDLALSALSQEAVESPCTGKPESETPETKQCSICLAHPPYGACAGDESCAYIMMLERQYSLALTEIKGHMRVEDELKAEVANYRARESDLDLGVLHRALDKAQARIAELEKDAARYRWLRANHLQTGTDSWIRTGDDLEEAIDAALKSHI